ncbi:type i restriction-modification system methyltransferase subunit [Halogeometricum pallidum JCM 14848]|uniref:Type i restriction-modification system methyltransferase subunit n=1 Tax=Halogeometricum pallidum JCM 14848 TaxID=1227487 RepID=M0DG21_HALPD|nr:type I restriction-modification system methyltransferase subunit [Halogeometricum pallidum]ELZ34410.1 type i restriction-modification system methyltransferase subunit [Halogeometricum pallidum JCM 14848]
MTSAPPDDDGLDACEVLLDRYRAALRDRSDDSPAADARESWRAFVGEHHGSVFDQLADESERGSQSANGSPTLPNDADGVAREVFVRTLAFDFLLSTLSAAAEREFSVAVAPIGPSVPGGRSDLLAAFDAVHESVRSDLPPAVRTEADEAAGAFVRESDPAAVAELHRRTVPRPTRRAFGRYDTPPGLAELAVESVRGGGPNEFDDALVLDPGCGAGAFLAAAARAKRDAFAAGDAPDSDTDRDADPATVARRIAESVRGFDVNPVAVRASRLALVLALRPLLRRDGVSSFAPRVVLADATEATADDAPLDGARADVLLGNPPWLTWDSLTPRVKDRWREGPMADPALDLFPHRGREARLGHANDDLSVPYAWTCVHRFLRDGGRAAFVLKRDLMTGPAGELLRRRRVGDRPLSMRRVHDFGSLSPFGREVDAGTALYRLDVDAPGGADAPDDSATEDVEIPATRWSRTDSVQSAFGSLSDLRRTLAAEETAFVAADPTTEASPWIRADAERAALGPSEYRIRHGVKDDAKAVYALDRETIEAHDIEPDHVYPYLKSKHVVKYGLFGHDRHLVPQRLAGEDNEEALRREAPNTYAYLDANRERLESRGSSWFDGGPFYSLFGLGPYTWADYKVVWCRLGYKPHFAVVSTVEDPLLGEKPVVPGDHCMFVGTDDEREAHYLCGLLNSAPYQRCLRDISSGGKSSLSKSTVSRLAMPEWEASERQDALAEASMAAHRIVPDHVDCSKRAYNAKAVPELDAVQARVDRVAERVLAARDDQ